MKTARMIFAVTVVSLAAMACDLSFLFDKAEKPGEIQPQSMSVVQPEAPPTPEGPPAGPPVAADAPVPVDPSRFISFTGERVEKYYYRVDPVYHYMRVTLSSPDVNVDENNFTRFAQIHDVPVNLLESGGTYQADISATIKCYIMTYDYENQSWLMYADNATKSFTGKTKPAMDIGSHSLNYAANRERLDVSAGFSSDSYTLPKTGGYSNPYYQYRYRTYSYQLSGGLLYDLAVPTLVTSTVPHTEHEQIQKEELHSRAVYNDVVCSADVFAPNVAWSRNFYQYKSFAVAFDAGVPFDFKPNTNIVNSYSYDQASNTLSVAFKNYDEPFSGTVITFSIRAEGGDAVEKSITIGG
jgi:hypothetical protein